MGAVLGGGRVESTRGRKKGCTNLLTCSLVECLQFIERAHTILAHVEKCMLNDPYEQQLTNVSGVYMCSKLQRRRVSVSVFEENAFFLKKKHPKHPWFWNNHRSDFCQLSWTVRYINLENVAVFAVLLLHIAALVLFWIYSKCGLELNQPVRIYSRL